MNTDPTHDQSWFERHERLLWRLATGVQLTIWLVCAALLLAEVITR